MLQRTFPSILALFLIFSLFIWTAHGHKSPSVENVVYDGNLHLIYGIFHDFNTKENSVSLLMFLKGLFSFDRWLFFPESCPFYLFILHTITPTAAQSDFKVSQLIRKNYRCCLATIRNGPVQRIYSIDSNQSNTKISLTILLENECIY